MTLLGLPSVFDGVAGIVASVLPWRKSCQEALKLYSTVGWVGSGGFHVERLTGVDGFVQHAAIYLELRLLMCVGRDFW